MRKFLSLETLIILLLVLALAVPAVMAQDDHGEDDQAAETTDEHGEAVDDHSEDEAHEEEGAGGIAALGINTGFLMAQIINFLLIVGLLSMILWKPIVNMMDSRAAKIEKGLEDAAAAANARRNAEAEAEKILAQARAEAAQIVEEGRGRGEEVAKTVETEARTEANKIRDDARKAAESERNAQLADMRGQVVAIAVAVSERLIGETLSEKKQQALVEEFFTNVPADAKSLSGSVEVVSAMPLAEAEQAKVKKEIGADDVTFVVNPGILGGLIVRSGDRVIDGSVRTGLTNLSSRLN